MSVRGCDARLVVGEEERVLVVEPVLDRPLLLTPVSRSEPLLC